MAGGEDIDLERVWVFRKYVKVLLNFVWIWFYFGEVWLKDYCWIILIIIGKFYGMALVDFFLKIFGVYWERMKFV